MMVLLCSGAVPFALSFWPGLRLYRNLAAMASSIAVVLLVFGGWDVYATWRGHWYFNPSAVWGFRIINLPLEEVLFFVVIPFCCIFTWETLQYMKQRMR